MESLTSNRQAFTLFCVLPTNADTKKWKIFANVAVTFITLISTMSFLLASGIFTYKMSLVDMEQALYGLFEFTGMLSFMVIGVTSYIQRKNLLDIFEKLQHIYDTTANGLEIFTLKKLQHFD